MSLADIIRSRCVNCGQDLVIEDCEMCGGFGVDGHECGEDSCACANPEDNVPCEECDGSGRIRYCKNLRCCGLGLR